MLICDNGVIREATAEEMKMAEHLPDPESPTTEELLNIIMGVSE